MDSIIRLIVRTGECMMCIIKHLIWLTFINRAMLELFTVIDNPEQYTLILRTTPSLCVMK